jgi:hypothetical protein
MFGNNNTDGYIEWSRDDLDADRKYAESLEQRKTDDLIRISRLAVLLSQGKQLPALICGESTKKVLDSAKAFANGINMGSSLYRKYPWKK